MVMEIAQHACIFKRIFLCKTEAHCSKSVRMNNIDRIYTTKKIPEHLIEIFRFGFSCPNTYDLVRKVQSDKIQSGENFLYELTPIINTENVNISFPLRLDRTNVVVYVQEYLVRCVCSSINNLCSYIDHFVVHYLIRYSTVGMFIIQQKNAHAKFKARTFFGLQQSS